MKKIVMAAAATAGMLLSAPGFAGTGASQSDPILPGYIWTVSASNQSPGSTTYYFNVNQSGSGLWYDPPMIDGFSISLYYGATFNSVTAPTGFSGLQLLVNNQIVDADFMAGETYSFAPGISDFVIRSTQSPLDLSSSAPGAALPLKLSFSGASSMFYNMTWTALPSAVPESDIYLLMIGGLAALGLLSRRR